MGHLIRIVLALLGAAAVVTAPYLIGQSTADDSAVHGITPGALFGLLATWIGTAYGYANLRRSIRAEAERSNEQTARRVAKEEIEAAMTNVMERREQEAINAKNDERYALLLKLKGITLSE